MRLSVHTALFLFALVTQVCHADIYLIVNKNSPAQELSKKQVVDIYLGKNRSFENGKYIQTIDHRKSSKLREDFYHKLTGKPISFVNAYWARLFYTGRKNRRMTTTRTQKKF